MIYRAIVYRDTEKKVIKAEFNLRTFKEVQEMFPEVTSRNLYDHNTRQLKRGHLRGKYNKCKIHDVYSHLDVTKVLRSMDEKLEKVAEPLFVAKIENVI